MVERSTVNRMVAGSSPASGAMSLAATHTVADRLISFERRIERQRRLPAAGC